MGVEFWIINNKVKKWNNVKCIEKKETGVRGSVYFDQSEASS